MSPSLTISIVNWNTREHLERCVGALQSGLDGLEAEIIVVDNASTDGSVEMIRERFPGVRVIALAENVGFAAGNNIAIGEGGGEYVLVMNPDVYVRAGTVRACVDFLEQNPAAAAVGPTLVGKDGRVQAEYFRRFPSRMQVLLFYTLLVKGAARIPFLRHRYLEYPLEGTHPISIDQVPGAFMVVKRSVIDEVGMLDPGFFIFFEDVDWCFRMREAGYDLFALPDVQVTHAGNASFELWSVDRQVSQFFRSFFRFLSKHGMTELMMWTRRVLATDLVAKEWIVAVHRILPFGEKRLPRPRSLRALRGQLSQLVQEHQAGRLSEFHDDGEPA